MKKRNSKDIFAETLLELSEKMSVDRITVTMLVKESGLSAKTFYNHFPNIFALMIYIEEAEARKYHEKLLTGNYSLRDYMVDCLHLYSSLRRFMRNAFDNTSGAEAFEKLHADLCYRLTLEFLLKQSHLETVPMEVDFALRMYIYGMVKVFHDYFYGDCKMTETEFVDNCLGNMPKRLGSYFV